MLKFDELNNIIDEYKAEYRTEGETLIGEEKTATEDDLDAVVEFLILAYMWGFQDAKVQIRLVENPDQDKMRKAIDEKVAGENWRERLKNGSDLATIVETEGIRVYNQGVMDAGETKDGVMKMWVTRGDEKVRDTHDYLEGVIVPLNEKFYTFDDDSAYKPGGFSKAENNVNCRCRIELSEGTEQTQNEENGTTENGEGTP